MMMMMVWYVSSFSYEPFLRAAALAVLATCYLYLLCTCYAAAHVPACLPVPACLYPSCTRTHARRRFALPPPSRALSAPPLSAPPR